LGYDVKEVMKVEVGVAGWGSELVRKDWKHGGEAGIYGQDDSVGEETGWTETHSQRFPVMKSHQW
jgi:hypothetical protein